MVTAQSLQQQLNAKVSEIKQIVGGIDEQKAAAADAEGWSVKHILSHLAGSEAGGFVAGLRRFVDEDTPDLKELVPGDTYFEQRKDKSAKELLGMVERQYAEVGDYVGGLSDEQLGRKGHIGFLKETPLGEYPTLAQWTGAIINFHLADHINQLRTICQ